MKGYALMYRAGQFLAFVAIYQAAAEIGRDTTTMIVLAMALMAVPLLAHATTMGIEAINDLRNRRSEVAP